MMVASPGTRRREVSLEAPGRLEATTRAGLDLVLRFLHAHIAGLRAAGVPVGEDDYRGLYISEREVDRLLAGRAPRHEAGQEATGTSDLGPLRRELAELVDGAEGRLGRLIAAGPFRAEETGAILLALAAESDPGVERLVAYAQDDVSRRRPRVGLMIALFAAEPFAGRDAWQPAAPLRALHVVQLLEEDGPGNLPLGSRTVALDPRITEYLLGGDAFAEPLAGRARFACGNEINGGLVPEMTAARLRRITTLPPGRRPATIALSGDDGGLTRAAAASACGEASLDLLVAPIAELAAECGLELAVTLATREATLRDTALLLEGASSLPAGELPRLAALLERERPCHPLTFVALHEAATWPGLRVHVPPLDFRKRARLWAAAIGEPADAAAARGAVESVAARFHLDVDAIQRAGAVARRASEWDGRTGGPTLEDLFDAARGQSTPILSGLAQKVASHFSWDDLVLPPDGIEHLREISGRVEFQHHVLETWGFARKLGLGRGAIALFAGNSGTGKTMAAGVMANSLSLDLYRVDLSAVVSKYIGETEKNLDAIFREAERSNAILFFDEADALFGKRSEVKDAHDRYANIETAYLLQRMEGYPGIVILATNLKMNMDEAFIRRLHFAVDFPMPNEAHRRLIWEKAFPREAPLAGDIDWEFLGRQFKISGGNIKNSVIAAAFFAAAEGTSIEMRHIVRGIRREYQKLGRMVTPAEFGPYTSIVTAPDQPS